jgi:hypothetical protein
MGVPYTFAFATAPIPLSQLDENFASTIQIGSDVLELGSDTSSLTDLYLYNVNIQSTDAATFTSPAIFEGGIIGNNDRISGFYGPGFQATSLAVGDDTLLANTTGTANIAIGDSVLKSNTTGSENTGVGFNVLYTNTIGIKNTAVGTQSMHFNLEGNQNTAIGHRSMYNTIGDNNIAVGYSSLTTPSFSPWGGSNNIGIGNFTLGASTTSNYNVAIGTQAMKNTTIGTNNITIGPTNASGYSPVFDVVTESNRIVMGHNGISNAYVRVSWTVTSDARDKTNFSNIPHGLDFVSKLEPISYQFKESRENDVAQGRVRYGFKAQDILALESDNPIIIDNEDPDHLKLNTDALVPILVNAIKELKAELALLKSKVES